MNRLSTRMLLLAALMTVLTLTIGIVASIVITNLDLYDLTAEMPRQAWLELRGLVGPEADDRARFADLYRRYSDTAIRPQDWWFIAVTALLSTAIGGGIASVFARRLSRPITAVAQASARVAEGQADVRVPRAGASGELGELVDSFNTMAAAIDAYQRERGILTAGIAHELRTPLTVLRGRLHGLIDGVIRMEPGEAERLLRHVDKLSRVVEDLRALAHAEAKTLELAPQSLSALAAAELVASDLEPLAAERGVAIRVTGEDAALYADPVRLNQALANLVVNALRHAPPGDAVTVAVRPSGDAVELIVSDAGPGFPAQDRERLFAPFWRANSPANAGRPGSGIGLSLALKIAQAHRGTITAASPPGGGATFTLRLPRA